MSGKQERSTPRPGLEPEPDVEMAEKCLFWGWGGADVSPISPHLRKPTPQPGLGIDQAANVPSLDINMNGAQPVSKHIKLSFEKQNMWIKLLRVDNQGLTISCSIYMNLRAV